MKKVLLMGNSHAGSIKCGLDMAIAQGLLDIVYETCCGAAGSGVIQGLYLESEKSQILHSTLKEAPYNGVNFPVKLSNYDSIVLTGPINPLKALVVFAKWQSKLDSAPVSESLVYDSFRFRIGQLQSYPDFRLYSQLLDMYSKKCIYVGRPISSPIKPKPVSSKFHGSVMKLKEVIVKRLADTDSFSVVFPPASVLDGLTTKSKFLRGGVNVEGLQHDRSNSSDRSHMNPEYGLEIVKEMIACGAI